jgi:hypothetical protein
MKSAHLSSLRHHRSHPTQMSTAFGSEVEGSEEVTNKSYIRHSTSYDTSGSTTSATVCSCLPSGKSEKNKSRRYKRKPQKATSNMAMKGC